MRAFIGIAISLLVVLTLVFLLAESLGLTSVELFTSKLEALRDSSHSSAIVGVVITGLLTSDLAFPVPSSVLMMLAGYFLGWIIGAAAAFAGAMGSSLLGFALCRRFGRNAFNRLIGDKDTARVAAFFERYGAWAIILSRSVPMLTEVMSCMAGLSMMTFGRFAALSVAGTLPICAVYAWAGSRSGAAAAATGIGWAVLLAFVIPAVGLGIVKLMERGPREQTQTD